MAEELKCVLMSTPKYKTSKTRRTVQEDKLRWSPDSIVAPGNLKSHSQCSLSDIGQDSNFNVNNHHHHQWPRRGQPSPPPYPQALTPPLPPPPSSSPRSRGPPPPYVTPPGHSQARDRGTQSPAGHPHLHLDQSKFFGTPCDLRAARLGLPGGPPAHMEASFEGNQSFPKASRPRHRPDPATAAAPGDVTVCVGMRGGGGHSKLDAFQGNGMNDISFSASQPRKKYFPRLKDVPAAPPQAEGWTPGNASLSESWSFSGFLGNNNTAQGAPPALPSTVRNPNKAICTITAATSEILTANDMACELFGYEEDQLVGQPLKDLLRLKSKEQEAVKETHLELSGQIVSLAGKVVEVLDSNGLVLPVSLWVKRLDGTGSPTGPGSGGGPERLSYQRHSEPRLLCVMEPVERTVGRVHFDGEGEIQWCDTHMAQLCGYASPHQVCGLHMRHIIPAFLCPDPSLGLTKEVKKQRSTGRTRDGASFPLSIAVKVADDMEDSQDRDGNKVTSLCQAKVGVFANICGMATVWVFANISGMISLRPDGTIHSLNENFARLLFGYTRSQLVGHSISKLIPDFFTLLDMDIDPLPLPPLHDDLDMDREAAPDKGGALNSAASFCQEDLLPATSTPCMPAVHRQPSSGSGRPNSKSTSTSQTGQHPDCASVSTPTGRPRNDFSSLLIRNASSSLSVSAADGSQGLKSGGNGSVRGGGSVDIHAGNNVTQEKLDCVERLSGSQKRLKGEDSMNGGDDKKLGDKDSMNRGDDDKLGDNNGCADKKTGDEDSKDGGQDELDDNGWMNGGEGERGNKDWRSGAEERWGCELSFKGLPDNRSGGDSTAEFERKEKEVCGADSSRVRPNANPTVISQDLENPSGERTWVPGVAEDVCRTTVALPREKRESNPTVIGQDLENPSGERTWVPGVEDVCHTTVALPKEKRESTPEQLSGGGAGTGGKISEGGFHECQNLLTVHHSSSSSFSNGRSVGHKNSKNVKKNGCDIVSSVHGQGTTPSSPSPFPSPSPSPSSPCEAWATALSPIKPVKTALFDVSASSSDVDVANESCLSDSTTDLLTARIMPACDVSDLALSEDEGRGESSGQGVAADVSGNTEDSSFGAKKDGSSSSSACSDGRKQLGASGSRSFQSRVISGGLDNANSNSSTSSEGSVEDRPHPHPGARKPRPFLPTSPAHDPLGDTLLEDESSYFSREGATSLSASNPSASSSNLSHASGSGKGRIHDSWWDGADLSPEGMRHRDREDALSQDHTSSQAHAPPPPPHSSFTPTAAPPPPGLIPEGSFSGQGRHRDGGNLGVVFQIRRVTLADGSEMLLLWLSRDPEDICEASRSHGNLTLASSFNSTLDQSHHSLGDLLQEQANSESKLEDIEEADPSRSSRNQQPLKQLSPRDLSGASENGGGGCPSNDVTLAGAGDYSQHYTTLTSIGKGAFGFVKLALRQADRREVVVKFIRRSKVLRESWVKDGRLGVVPMEVFLLSRLKHPNIVTVEDVFQNEDFIQLVMERHGGGMDLFEFIDRNPRLDEALTSHIFRQMVSGVSYLHGQSIVHRDIKDENIIINEHFNIKLIDFGAAAYMTPGKLFGTFCGTIEYCSPEVLMGNKYGGPELEMWSLGITLYTLIFGENPFFDIEETLEGVLKPPAQVSRALMFLITWLLNPDPLSRATIADVERNAWVNQAVDPSRYLWDSVLPNTEFHGNTACDSRQTTPVKSSDTPHHISNNNSNSDAPHHSGNNSDTQHHSSSNNSDTQHHSSSNNSNSDAPHHSPNITGVSDNDLDASHHHRKSSHDRIEDVVTSFNQLLQMHDNLDSDY